METVKQPKKFSKLRRSRERRERVVGRLEAQLKLGKKPQKGLVNPHLDEEDTLVPLEEKDVKRIKHELEILKIRI